MTTPVAWRKSSKSGPEQGDCVEVAALTPGTVGLRDSKDADGPHLSISAQAFGQLVQQLKAQ
jgi:hypothetical protein